MENKFVDGELAVTRFALFGAWKLFANQVELFLFTFISFMLQKTLFRYLIAALSSTTGKGAAELDPIVGRFIKALKRT